MGVACSDNGSSPALPLARALATITKYFNSELVHVMLKLFKNRQKELTKSRLKLEEDLRNRNLDYLISQMASDELYSPLLTKKRKSEISNTDNVSWYAYRRAEELYSDEDKEGLIKMLDNSSYALKRSHILFALAHLCKNRTDNQLFNVLMDEIEGLKDTNCKLSILIGIARMRKAIDLNIEPLKRLTNERSRVIKVNAILSLQQTMDKSVEPILLEIFNSTKDNHVKGMICVPLESIGTEKSIPYLKSKYKTTRDYGLRYYIERALDEINKRLGEK